jgi:hypothetical protein
LENGYCLKHKFYGPHHERKCPNKEKRLQLIKKLTTPIPSIDISFARAPRSLPMGDVLIKTPNDAFALMGSLFGFCLTTYPSNYIDCDEMDWREWSIIQGAQRGRLVERR